MARIEHVRIRCAGGVGAELRSLEQHETYLGLWDGAPTHDMNEQMLEELAVRRGSVPTHVVRPAEVPMEHANRHSSDHTHAQFPKFQCRGLFASGMSVLEIVWFQDTWAPPLSPAAKFQLREFDFFALAVRDFMDPDGWCMD
jgi:hypothetical protein